MDEELGRLLDVNLVSYFGVAITIVACTLCLIIFPVLRWIDRALAPIGRFLGKLLDFIRRFKFVALVIGGSVFGGWLIADEVAIQNLGARFARLPRELVILNGTVMLLSLALLAIMTTRFCLGTPLIGSRPFAKPFASGEEDLESGDDLDA